MTLTVSTDLSVGNGPSSVDVKLMDKQKELQENIAKGEPKIFAVTQIVIGFLIISYSITLLSPEPTMIMKIGLPWWSGLMYILSGACAIAVEKRANMKTVSACFCVSLLAIITAVLALVLYFIDIAVNPPTECDQKPSEPCNPQYYVTNFSHAMKSCLSVVNIVQIVVSSIFTVILYKEKRNFKDYAMVTE